MVNCVHAYDTRDWKKGREGGIFVAGPLHAEELIQKYHRRLFFFRDSKFTDSHRSDHTTNII